MKFYSFFEIEAWTTLARYVTSQFKKGTHMRVIGRLKQERWEDPEGNSRSKVKVVGEHVEPIVSEQEESKGAEKTEEAGSLAVVEADQTEFIEEEVLV